MGIGLPMPEGSVASIFCTAGISAPGHFASNMRIPLDNESLMFYRLRWSWEPITQEQLHEYKHGGYTHPELTPGTWMPKANLQNAPADYERSVLPWMKRLFDEVGRAGAPTIYFGTGNAALLELMASAGSDVMSVDWRMPLDVAWERIGTDRGIQGNLEPTLLVAPWDRIERGVRDVLRRANGRRGHVFNLGHGVPAETPYENLTRIVQVVHDLTSDGRAQP